MTAITALLLLLGTGAANSVPAVRCNGKLIDVGDSLAYVLAQCGEPEHHTRREVPARSPTPLGGTFVSGVGVSDIVIYDRGFGRFPLELEFVHGRLRHIEYLPR